MRERTGASDEPSRECNGIENDTKYYEIIITNNGDIFFGTVRT